MTRLSSIILLLLRGDKMLALLTFGEGFCLESRTCMFEEVCLELIGGSCVFFLD